MDPKVLDPVFTRGLKLLLSSDADAADQLRTLLDEALRQKYGPSKMISAVMPHKKLKVEEGYSVGVLPMTMRGKKERSSLDSSGSPAAQSGQGESEESNQSLEDSGDDNELTINMSMLGEDLTCVVCGQMDVGARNQLVECAECHSLYHQDCHRPPLLEIAEPPWYCSGCSKKVAVTTPIVVKQEVKQEKSSIISSSSSSPVQTTSVISSGTSSSSSTSSKIYSGSSKSSSKPSSSSHKSSSSGSSSSKHSSSKKSSSSSSSSHKHHHKSSSKSR